MRVTILIKNWSRPPAADVAAGGKARRAAEDGEVGAAEAVGVEREAGEAADGTDPAAGPAPKRAR